MKRYIFILLFFFVLSISFVSYIEGGFSFRSLFDLVLSYIEVFLKVLIYLSLWYCCVYFYKKIKNRKKNK